MSTESKQPVEWIAEGPLPKHNEPDIEGVAHRDDQLKVRCRGKFGRLARRVGAHGDRKDRLNLRYLSFNMPSLSPCALTLCASRVQLVSTAHI